MATMVERQSRRKTRMTRMTRPMPSMSVLSTPLIEARMNCDSSYMTLVSVPGGRARLSFSSSARTPSATVSVFAVAWRTMPRPSAMLPSL